MPATFDPEAFLAEPAAPAFDPNAFLAEPAPAFDPAAFLGKSQDAAPVQPQEFDPATAYYGDFASLGNNLTADQLARAKQQLMEPLIKLPTMPDLSAMPAPQTPFINETSLTPAQAAGVYNAVKGPIEGLSSPFNLGIMGMTGGLGTAAAAGSMGAKAALVGTGVGFGALAAVDTVKLVQQAREVLADPATTEQQRTQAATAPVVSGLMGLAALAGAGRLAAGEAIPRINAAYPEVFWKKSGLNAEQFAAEYPAAVRRVAGVGGETPTPADVALVQQINAAADAAGVKLGDLARGRMVAENITWEPRAVQAIIPESLLPTQPTSSLSFRATGANGTRPARQPVSPVAASASEPTPGTPAAAGPNALLLRDAPLAPAPVSPGPPRPIVPPAQADLNAALALQARPVAPVPPSAPAQVAPPEPAAAPVDNAPVVATLPAEVPAAPAAPLAPAPFDPVAFIAAPEPVAPVTPVAEVAPAPAAPSAPAPAAPTAEAPAAPAAAVPIEKRLLRDFPAHDRELAKVLRSIPPAGSSAVMNAARATIKQYLNEADTLPLMDAAEKYKEDFTGEAMARDLTPKQIEQLGKRIMRRLQLHSALRSAGIPWEDPLGKPGADLYNATIRRPESGEPLSQPYEGLSSLLGKTLAAAKLKRGEAPAPAQTPAAAVPVAPSDTSLLAVETAAIKLTQLKGAINKGDGIWFIPKLSPSQLRQLRTEREQINAEFPRGGPNVEIKRWADVVGDPYANGYAILDRRDRNLKRARPATVAPTAEAPPAAPAAAETPAAAPAATPTMPAAPAATAPAADYEDLLKVEVPDASTAEAATRANQAQLNELNAEVATALATLKTMEAKVIKRTGPMYQRGRVKASAKTSDVKAYEAAQANVERIRQAQETLRSNAAGDARANRIAQLARAVGDPKRSLVQRLALRLDLYERRNEVIGPVSDRLSLALDQAAEVEVRARVPDATPAEIKALSNGVKRAAYGMTDLNLDRAWQMDPELNVHKLRREELGAALRKLEFNRWKDQASELNQEVNRYTEEFKGQLDKSQKRELAPLTRGELAAVVERASAERQRIEGERLAVERMQQAKAEASAKRQGITKIVTAEGITIAPTPPIERRVSKLADRAQLKAQREFLEKALREAAATAPDEGSIAPEYQADYEALKEHLANWRGVKDTAKAGAGIKAIAAKYLDLPPAEIKGGDSTARLGDAVLFNLQGRVGEGVPAQLVVEVPGDGTFRVANWKETILNLAEAVRKEFGRGLAAPAVSSPAVRGRSLPALGKVGTPAEINKILAQHVHETPGHIMGQLLQDGPWTIAGKGTYMFLVQGGKGRGRNELGDKFPALRAMLAREAPELRLTDAKGQPRAQLGEALYKLPLDVTTQLKVVNSAIAAFQADGKKEQIQFHVSGDALGISYVSVVDGTAYKSDGVLDGAPAVATIDGYIWRDVLETFRRFGIEAIELAIPAAPKDRQMAGTLSVRGGDTVAAIIKQRISEQAEAAPSFEDPAAPAPAEPSAETSAKRGSRGANASPGFAAAPPMAAPGGPPKNKPAAPADDPAFTELPIELPEAVQFFKLLTGGQYAHIRERIRALNGQAAGVFRYREGDLTSGEIELRADLFNLLSLAEKQDLLRQAVAWANAMRQGDSTLNEQELIRSKFEELVRAAEKASIAAGPVRALATFWHEVGHFLDFYPQATTKRGNILGRLASLNHYFKNFLAKSPGLNAEPPTSAERAAYRRQAERELTATVSSIVETIRREEPVYREIPITADTITGVVKNLARDEFPEFYDWFAKLPRADKVSVLRQAMKGLVDERAAKFGRREATGEVKVVEETVTRVTGTPPTPEAIRARYEELLRAELESRGLINEKDIRAELEGAIAWWRGTKTVPEYFKPSVELWADTMSIFFNNPAALAKRAPKFYEAFMRWMAVKPGIREEYDKIQHAIKSGQIYRDRVTNLREMFVRDDAAGALTDEFATRTSFKQDVDVARLLFDRQFGPIERRIGRNPTDIQGQRALSALGNFRYRATGWEAFAQAMRNEVEVPLAAANLTHLDMAEYMFHRRITDGLYRNLAAPLGWNPKNSGERLAEMERDLGPARWQSLVAAQVALRGIYEKRVVTLLHEAKVMSPELAAAVDKEIFYAPFNKARVYEGGSLDAIEELIKVHHGDEAAGQIYGSVGNLGEIRSPYVQLMHRAMGLISMSHRQLALKRVVDWLRVHEPLSVADSPMKWDGKRLAPVRVENSRVSTLYLLNQGKVEAVYVPRVIGEMFASGGPMEMRMIALSHTLLSPPKALLTELNPGFWPVAFAKDVWSATVSLPGGQRVMQNLPRSYLAAYRTFYGKPDPLAQQVLDRKMLISRADSRGEHLGHADEMTRILLRLGKSPAQWGAEVGRIEQVLRMLWRGWAQQGQIFERTVKIASMRALDQAFPAMPEARKQELVRTRGGSPDFLSKGRWARVVELGLGLMFYNAWKEGARSTYRAMAENPRGFWSKFAATAGAAGAVMWALEAGLVGDDEEELRDMLRSIPERDKLRGLVLPLGWNDKAAKKVLYLVLPFPESIRWAHALQRKALQTSAGNSARKEGLGSVVNYQGQDLPGQNPWITSTSEIYDYYVKGINPYDDFTGRPALDQTRVDAEQAGGELAKRTISNVTGGIAYRYRPERPGEKFTTMEEFLKAPVVSNLLGRWLRVSNRGLDELYRQSTEGDVREQASLRLVGEEMIARTLKGEPWAQEHLALVGTSEYLANYINDAGPRLAMQADSPYLRALTQAKTNAEKVSIWKVENERNQAKVKRLDRHIGTPPPPPP